MRALKRGYPTLVEKPLSPHLNECEEMIDLALVTDQWFMLGYPLRFTPFFQKIKSLLAKRAIATGHVSLEVNVAYWHFAHSFTRGNWNRSDCSSPMILAKCCHDFDILLYLLEQKCVRLSSFGDLGHFKREEAPAGAASRCLDGCDVEPSCPFSALKIYLGEHTGWPVSTISEDRSLEGRKRALEVGPYGRCVYHCDNDVVDHQTVSMQFENGATALLTMSAFTERLSRKIRILGTEGELSGEMEARVLEVTRSGNRLKRSEWKTPSFSECQRFRRR